MKSQKFFHLTGHFYPEISARLYTFLRDGIKWEDGIRSRKGHTRSAAMFELRDFLRLIDDFPEIMVGILEIIEKYSVRKSCAGLYLNYYKDGNDWTPNHTHPGTTQIVISLGTTRTFEYCKKPLPSGNGDVIVFGSSIHGVPKEPAITEGRISIALFMMDAEEGASAREPAVPL
jgi:hypothetical protein